MPIQLSPPIEEEFILEKSDEVLGNTGEPTTIKVKQALEGENLIRMQLWKRFERRSDFDTTLNRNVISVTQDVSPAEVKRKEIFLTLIACNLEIPTGKLDKDGNPQYKPLFKFPLIEREFNEAYAKLPPVIADEIHEKVLVVNITWAMEGED